MSKIVKIGMRELRKTISAVRDRVVAGDTYLCTAYNNKVKAELVPIDSKITSNKINHLSTSCFRGKLTECYRAIEADPNHPGFVVSLYGRPWGIFRRRTVVKTNKRK